MLIKILLTKLLNLVDKMGENLMFAFRPINTIICSVFGFFYIREDHLFKPKNFTPYIFDFLEIAKCCCCICIMSYYSFHKYLFFSFIDSDNFISKITSLTYMADDVEVSINLINLLISNIFEHKYYCRL